jgi:hypothetical protein
MFTPLQGLTRCGLDGFQYPGRVNAGAGRHSSIAIIASGCILFKKMIIKKQMSIYLDGDYRSV